MLRINLSRPHVAQAKSVAVSHGCPLKGVSVLTVTTSPLKIQNSAEFRQRVILPVPLRLVSILKGFHFVLSCHCHRQDSVHNAIRQKILQSTKHANRPLFAQKWTKLYHRERRSPKMLHSVVRTPFCQRVGLFYLWLGIFFAYRWSLLLKVIWFGLLLTVGIWFGLFCLRWKSG